MPSDEPLDAKTALDVGILALTTLLRPVSEGIDTAILDRLGEHALKTLAEVREWVIAQGDDFENRLAEDRPVVASLDTDTPEAP